MRKHLQYLEYKLSYFSLNTKIIFIILVVLFINVAASLISIDMVLKSSNRLLYESLQGSLNYTAEDISFKLSNIESMSSSILSNQNIRKNLIALEEETSEIGIRNIKNTLKYLISDYYQTYKLNNISYINLYNPRFVTYSYESKSTSTPDDIHQAVIQKANENSGYPCWVTDYCNTYGLFLGRDSRKINNLKYETIGTLVVSIDMEKMIKSSTQSLLDTDFAQYIIYDGTHEIFHSKSLDASTVVSIQSSLSENYDVLKIGKSKYFCVRGTISNPSWNYICLIPYDYISDTINMSMLLSLSVILFCVIMSLILSRLLIRSIMKDFYLLIQKMDAFGKDESKLPDIGGHYDHRKDEIGMLHNQFDQMAIKLQLLIQENYVNEILRKDAKIKALESQINPHFLYNTLESVNWRAKAIGEKEISLMIESLGSLLRVTLGNKDTQHTVADDLDIVKCYINIQKIRFPDRLSFIENVEPSILHVEIPLLILQPLVENAINYGMEESIDVCHIEIEGHIYDETVFISIINSGSQFEEHLLEKLNKQEVIPHGFGIGLLNIHQRIQLTYGSSYGLNLYNKDEDTAVAQVTIPVNKI